MWIYTKDGFYSVVEDRDNPGLLLVRARVEGDIERQWPQAMVERNAGTDYLYRARMPREAVALALDRLVSKIDYTNFKDSISDSRRSPWYMKVWTTMWDMQTFLREK
jgi:hypothetical protein